MASVVDCQSVGDCARDGHVHSGRLYYCVLQFVMVVYRGRFLETREDTPAVPVPVPLDSIIHSRATVSACVRRRKLGLRLYLARQWQRELNLAPNSYVVTPQVVRSILQRKINMLIFDEKSLKRSLSLTFSCQRQPAFRIYSTTSDPF